MFGLGRAISEGVTQGLEESLPAALKAGLDKGLAPLRKEIVRRNDAIIRAANIMKAIGQDDPARAKADAWLSANADLLATFEAFRLKRERAG